MNSSKTLVAAAVAALIAGSALANDQYGDKDKAFEALNKAAEEVPHRTAFLLVCPEMDSLRGDPRFAELRKRLNLP